MNDTQLNGSEIAIIGLSGRFTGAKDVAEFWLNLQNGVNSVHFFTDEELASLGVEPEVLQNPNYVKAASQLEDVELFDATFFSFNPREAEITDPQHRIFLECAWQALENAGCNSEIYPGAIGVFAGSSMTSYLLNVYLNQNISFNGHQLSIAGDKDYLTTRVSYKLNLTGPSYTVQTACSTSLVAVHLACQSLLNGECDMALAGGVSISSSRNTGYLYQEGGINSPDGYCRAFDAKAQGTIGGEGVGIVVLKRLEDALTDRDFIHAVIKGSAINNDGANKVSYTAPRIDGQAKAIKMAQVVAEVEPETITYIEAHGTGTSLGDPIEIAALTQVFQASTQKKGFCAIGSVKTNIGHLDAAAGVTGLIKTVLALKHKQIPPSLNFEKPNPQIDFANSPFYVNTALSPWEVRGIPRRAGVSSFGIGGTNAHIILEEAPSLRGQGSKGAKEQRRNYQLLVLSAKTDSALETATTNLVDYLQQHPNENLADIAYTLGVGRRTFDHRRMLVCQNLDDAMKALESSGSGVFTHYQEARHCPVVFMFSGQGSQYVNMGRELYETEPIFREQINNCCKLLQPHLGIDLRELLYPSAAQHQETEKQMKQTVIAQPALFVVEYALAQLWMAWGVHPQVMIGHSIGEYVAACLAGVFSLEDALFVVAMRGRLMQQVPAGAMLAVPLSQAELQPLLGEELAIAVYNTPSLCVVAGPVSSVEQLQHQLRKQGVECRLVHTSHAFHSPIMSAIIEPFTQLLQTVKLNPPKIPFLSNVSGTWITTAEATDPNYWAKHLRQPVRFSEGVIELLKQPERILLEVGPGRTLSSLVKQHQVNEQLVLTSIRHPQEQQSDVVFVVQILGRLWLAGVQVDWSVFYGHQQCHRLPLPTYPFERQRYWIEANPTVSAPTSRQEALHKKSDIADWFYIPRWQQSIPLGVLQTGGLTQQKLCWLVFVDAYEVGAEVAKRLEKHGQNPIAVRVGEQFAQLSDGSYTINPEQRHDYHALLQALQKQGLIPQAIAHFWIVTPNDTSPSSSLSEQTQYFDDCQKLGFYSLLFLAQALAEKNLTEPTKLMVITSNVHDVTGEENICPHKATVIGSCKVIPQEYPHITCCNIDVLISANTKPPEKLIDQLLGELTAQSTENVIAYRGHHRWIQTYEAVRLDQSVADKTRLRKGGIYLITGGLGSIGLSLAEYLAQKVQAKLILLGRTDLPVKEQWPQWLATHDEQDIVSCKLRKLQALEALGAEVLVISADVANEQQMHNAIATAITRFGAIHGVIHAAGNLKGSHIAIQETSITETQLQFHPKVYGLFVLEKVLQGQKLDFCVLTSSLSSILGGLGFISYSAANIFMDAFVHQRNQENACLWQSINWDGWQTKEEQQDAQFSMKLQEGIKAFERILSMLGVPQMIVSTGDLQGRIDKWIKLESLRNTKSSSQKDLFSNHQRPNLNTVYVAPRNEVEQTVTEIWQKLLGVEQIGIHDNFFELGGHSLLGTQVISHLRKAFLIDLPLRHLFDEPTIAGISNCIEKKICGTVNKIAADPGSNSAIESIKPITRDANLPLSFAQQRLWFIDQIDPGNHAYNLPTAVRLTGLLNITALEQSLNAIVSRHETLRTIFTTVEGQPVQKIQPITEITIPIVNLKVKERSPQQREAQAKRIALEEAQRPFNLAQGPLLRVILLQLDETEYVLLLTMHHIISDLWSMAIFIRELADFYAAFCQSKPLTLPDLPIQYADFAVWQREWMQGKVLETQLAYWKQQLQNAPTKLELPTDKPRPLQPTYTGTTQSFQLPKDLSDAVKLLSQREDVTLSMSLLTAYNTLLYYYTKQEDILVGSAIANRNRSEIEGLIGFFVNSLVLRTDLSGNPSFSKLLRRTREVTLGAYTHQDLPFEKLVGELQLERDLNYNPLFQVWFAFQNIATPDIQKLTLSLPDLTLSPFETNKQRSPFDLGLLVSEQAEGISGCFEYKTDLFELSTIVRMTEHLETVLQCVVTQPDIQLNQLVEKLKESDYEQQLTQEKEYKNTVRQKLMKIKQKSNISSNS